ncbi:hypothetical protein LUZ61_020845 [Rhynchospora tenuis]|uniref:Heat shock protein 70 n=1 Tax=Rhynchospora tenuis TaxID=198213 RepID=A0AAD6EPF3_9POAL|nr:hypothetical protein LUZ61_020845 [Rhynchospora tenuis]
MVLSKMKEIIESYLNSKVTKAVICVPACFNDSQRKAIKDAGALAGLNVMQLLNEPTAAAIFYYLQKKVGAKSPDPKNLLIFYLGGGNLDVSIAKLNNCTIQVCAVVGDTNLGGQDFDNNLVCHFVKKFMKEKNLDISNKPKSLRRLRAACKAKRVLSTYVQTVVEIDASDEGNDFHSSITRAAFEELSSSLFKRSIDCVERCLEEAKMNKDCIDDVVLMGGSTRIPKVYQILKDFYKGKELCKSMNSDEAVAYGAAVQAAILNGNCDCDKLNYTLKIQDITALSFGLGSKDGAIMNNEYAHSEEYPYPSKNRATDNHLFRSPVKLLDRSAGMRDSIHDSKDTSTSEKIEIVTSKNNDGLTPEEIEQMVKAASRYKKEDEEQKMISAAALNSLKNMAYDMKAAATNPFQSASNKKLMEEAADRAIVWMNTIHHAEIEEINAWKRMLEIIKTQVELVLT